MKIECPVCEDRFEFPDSKNTALEIADGNTRIKCPTCHREFARTEFNTVSDFIPTAEVVDPPLVQTSTPSPTGVSNRRNEVSQLQNKSSALVQHRRSRKKKQPWIVAFATLIVFASLAGLAYFLLATDVLVPWPDPENEKKAELINAIEQAKQTPKNTEVETPPKKLKKSVEDTRIPKPDSRILSEKKLKQTWVNVRPYIVKLTAQTPVGPKLVTGTIVDSRGWIATSYRAIQGATDISVSQTPKDILKSGDSGLVKDDVRGVIATDVDHDIAILSINRQLIISLTDLPLLAKDNLLGSMHLIQCVAPTKKFPWSTTECRLDRRRRLEDFTDEQKSALKADKITGDAKWIVHNNLSPVSAGSSLLTDKGEFAGITITSPGLAKVAPDMAIAAPVELLKKLLAGASDQPTSLPLPIVGPSATTSSGTAHSSGMPVLATTSQHHAASVAINKAGADCDAANWSTKTLDNTDLLISFAGRLLDAREYVADEKTTETEKATLEQQIEFWTKRFEEGVRAVERDDDQLAAFNKAAAGQLGFSAEAVFVAFVDVKLAAIESPRMSFETNEEQDTVTLHIVGTDKHVRTILDQDWPVLRPGSDWLVIGRGTGQQAVIRRSNGKPIRTESGTISFIFDASR